MDMFKALFDCCMGVLSLPLNIFGFEFTLWQVFLFSALSMLIARLIWGLIE